MTESPIDPGGFADVRDTEHVETIIRPPREDLEDTPTPPA